MKRIPMTPEIADVARRIIWFEPPEQAVQDAARFIAYALTYATHGDMKIILRHISKDELKEAVDGAPPGIVDPRSWAYWNNKLFGRYPAPPLPKRHFG